MIGRSWQVDRGAVIQHINQGQTMSLANFIIIEIVGWRDLQAASTELAVDIVVGDDGDLSSS